jgi:hypothetical protein
LVGEDHGVGEDVGVVGEDGGVVGVVVISINGSCFLVIEMNIHQIGFYDN